MKRYHGVLVSGFISFFPSIGWAADIGTAITYQGHLERHLGTPVTDTCNFHFILWDAATGGNTMGNTMFVNSVSVIDGTFTTTPDFGPWAFDGSARWLEIQVQCTGDPGLTSLSPRVNLAP